MEVNSLSTPPAPSPLPLIDASVWPEADCESERDASIFGDFLRISQIVVNRQVFFC
jgi:hypothetical protein